MAKNTGATRETWADPDDALEWTDDMIARAEISEGDRIIRRGRPPLGEKVKAVVTMRLEADVLEFYRALGPGCRRRSTPTCAARAN